jgi:hypothetical protein
MRQDETFVAWLTLCSPVTFQVLRCCAREFRRGGDHMGDNEETIPLEFPEEGEG